jgi:serine/threonine protein kinase
MLIYYNKSNCFETTANLRLIAWPVGLPSILMGGSRAKSNFSKELFFNWSAYHRPFPLQVQEKSMTNHNGKYLGRYQIMEQLGRGGMATVYKGFDPELERTVAIKVILQQEDHSNHFLMRFKREAKTLARLSHPNIVKILDYGEQDGEPFLVMDYIGGGSLATGIIRPVHWRKAAELLLPVARALEEAHHQGIIHRDVKPANILLSNDGTPMLSDFGIAKMLEYHETIDLTQNGVGIGTPEYMAPEQGTGDGADTRVDIYALGVVYYEMVTGKRPFTADTPLAVLFKHYHEPLPRPRNYVPDLPDDIERFIYKLMAKDPNQRYPSMGIVVTMLEKIASGTGLTRSEAPILTKVIENLDETPGFRGFLRRPLSWKPLAAIFGGVFLFFFLSLTALYIIQRSQPPKIITVTGGIESATPPVDFASISEVTGLVEVISADGSAIPIEEHMDLRVGGTFHLKSSNGQARLTLVNGSAICVPPNSEIEFLRTTSGVGGEQNMRFNLIAGGLLFIDPLAQSSSFQIDQPLPLTVLSQGAIIGLGKNAPERAVLNLDCLAGTCSFESRTGHLELNHPGSTWLDAEGNFSGEFLPQVSRWENLCGSITGSRVAGVPTPTRDHSIIDLFNGLLSPNNYISPTPRRPFPTPTQGIQPLNQSATATPRLSTRTPVPTVTRTRLPSSTATITPTTQPQPGETNSPTAPVFATPTSPDLTTSPTTESLLPPTFTPTPSLMPTPTPQPTAIQPDATTFTPVPTQLPPSVPSTQTPAPTP